MPAKSYTSGKATDKLFPVDISIQNAHGGWTTVSVLSDTGNQSTILKREVADQLGLDLSQGEPFMVGGINGEPTEFRRFKLWVRLGHLDPIQINVGFSTTREGLVENLLGNEDILTSGKYEARYDKNGVTFVEKQNAFRVATCAGEEYNQPRLNNLYDQLRPNYHRTFNARFRYY